MLSNKKYLRSFLPSLGGLVFFFLLFIYGLAKNMSMSYMGNTSSEAESYILNNFLGTLLFFLLKVLIVYLITGLILGIAAQIFIILFSSLREREPGFLKSTVFNFIITAFFFVIFFFKDLIKYPQVYMNNFYVRNDINKLLVDFLADNVNPVIFTIIQIFVITFLAILLIITLYKKKNYILKYYICTLIAVVVFLFLLFLIPTGYQARFGNPNVLILAADALRPDHLSGNGYTRNTTPNIDKIMKEGISFTNTYIEVPRTFPSWVSILTGRYASSHGIRHMFPTSRDINKKFNSITEILNKQNYETSVIGDFAADIFTRIDLGFRKVDTPYFNFNYLLEQIILEAHTGIFPFITGKTGLELFPVLKDSAYFCPPEFIKDKVISTIKNSEKSFFITSFFSSTHFPYASPYPYYKMYSEENYSGPYKYYKQNIISLDEIKEDRISDKDIKQIRALYDGGLKAFDDAVGEIIEFLSEEDILSNTIIIILSDHGENLYENDTGMGHGEHFRGKYSTRIPFIIRFPDLKQSGLKIDHIARAVDIVPTILSILNSPVPGYMEGKSLLPLIKGEKMEARYAFGETGIWFDNTVRDDLFFQKLRIMYPDITRLGVTDSYFDNQVVLKDEYRDKINLAKHRYIFDGRYKLIYMPLQDKIVYELYDTLKDPDEKRNIVSIDKHNFNRLRKRLFEWAARNGDVFIRNDYIFPIMRY
ncbi:MAG: sulfatase [Spirochaetes bacterium]|nr:sulfatase [Spirochaetota bacterium]